MRRLNIYIAKFVEPCRFHSLIDEVERDEIHPLIQFAYNNHWVLRFKRGFERHSPPEFRMFVARKKLADFEAHEFGFSDGFFLSDRALLFLNDVHVASNSVHTIWYKSKGQVCSDYSYFMFTGHLRNCINYRLSKFCLLRREVRRNERGIVEGYYVVIDKDIVADDYDDLLHTEGYVRKEHAFNAEFSPEVLVFNSGHVEELDLFSPFIIDNSILASERFKVRYDDLGLTGLEFRRPYGEYYAE